jgi:hypothetical protein
MRKRGACGVGHDKDLQNKLALEVLEKVICCRLMVECRNDASHMQR